MNKVVLIGRITRELELKGDGDRKHTRFNLAINRPGQDKGADFPSVVVFGRQAENAVKYLAKGRLVGIEGHINTSKYDKEGKTIYDTSVIADRVEYLEWGEKSGGSEDGFKEIDEALPWDY